MSKIKNTLQKITIIIIAMLGILTIWNKETFAEVREGEVFTETDQSFHHVPNGIYGLTAGR